ncbi:MAG: phytanoyl-CoA dioxygenase family protein [candidate division Zixibacteria bacterium]|nr:phytanoyl-CoA dioxygenase family protein [candidate division Zixibacteria bacterium]
MASNLIEDKRFKKLPSPEEIKTLDRDLRFHPVSVGRTNAFTPEEIERFNRQGYLKGYRIFDNTEIASIRTRFDDMLARVLAAGQHSYSIISAHLKSGMVHDILRDTRIVRYVTGLLGDDVVGWGAHFFCKMPGDGKAVSWHQDASYWPLSPSRTVTVWLAIDDADTENACMRFIAGSHHFGHLTYRLSEAGENNVLHQTVDGVEQYGTPMDDELKAGEVSFHSDLLLHGSEINRSSRRRCGLTLRYCAAQVRAGFGWDREGVIVAGSDPSGHWADNPRPLEDLV